MTTPAYTLNPGQKAGVVLTSAPGVGVSAVDFSAVSADPTIADIVDGGGNTVAVRYVSAGDAEITLHRIADGTSTTFDKTHTVHCIDPTVPPVLTAFDWELGTAVGA
jgi:hypothetical protein